MNGYGKMYHLYQEFLRGGEILTTFFKRFGAGPTCSGTQAIAGVGAGSGRGQQAGVVLGAGPRPRRGAPAGHGHHSAGKRAARQGPATGEGSGR